MENYVGNAIHKINEVQDLISSKKEFITKQIINAVLVLIIMVVFGCFDFAHPSFHFEYLADVSFWTGIIGKVVAVICAYNVGINFIIDDVIKRDETLIANKKLYESLNDCRQKDFDTYVYNVFNRQLKIEAYKSKITKQIFLLNKLSRRQDRLLYSSDNPDLQQAKANNRYCIKRSQLEELKSDDYINKNFNSIHVAYKDVDPSIFELEIDAKVKTNSIQVKGSLARGRIKSTSSVILTSVGIAAFTTALVLEPNKEEFESQAIAAMNYCIKALADAGTVIWQLFHGMISAKDIVSSQLTQSYAGRNRVLKGYYAWRMEKGEWTPQAYKDTLEEVKYAEITEQEFEAIKK